MPGRRALEVGGLIAGGLMLIVGIVALVMGFNARSTVGDELGQEFIVGSPDMTPAEIQKSAQEAGLPSSISLPTCDVAGDEINTGGEARCFASYMRIHALESTGGLTYAQMGRYVAKDDAPAAETDGKGGTSNAEYAVTDENSGQPASNPLRNLWINETALATALNVSYMAEQLAVFGIVVGIALLLAGIGFVILALAVFGRSAEAAAATSVVRPAAPAAG